jgi:enoyl-CoA hydratase
VSSIEVSIDQGVASVVIDNPGKRNAIDATLASALIETCRALAADTTVGAVVLSGANGYFCSGGDRAELRAASTDPLADENMQRMSLLYDSFFQFGSMEIPTVAAIRGGAVGAGLNLALAADSRVIAAEARLEPGFVRIGYHPGGGHMHLLHRAAGSLAAASMGMMGAGVDGTRAAQLGLAWVACPDHEVESAAKELVAPIAADPDLARYIKRSYRLETQGGTADWASALQIERAPQMWSFARNARR